MDYPDFNMIEKSEKNKIKVDKDFLDQIAKAVTENSKAIKELMENKAPVIPPDPIPPLVSPLVKTDYIFQCLETMLIDNPPTPEKMQEARAKSPKFKQELETLMKKYRVASLSALFLKNI